MTTQTETPAIQRRAKIVANLLNQTGRKLAKKYNCEIDELITLPQVATIVTLIEYNLITPQTGQFEFEQICKRTYYAK